MYICTIMYSNAHIVILLDYLAGLPPSKLLQRWYSGPSAQSHDVMVGYGRFHMDYEIPMYHGNPLISSTNWHVQNCSIRFVAFPHEFESPFESIDSEICIDLLRVEVTLNYPGDTASCSEYAPSQTQRSHIWLFSELRLPWALVRACVTLMCETAATHIGIPPNLLGIRWNRSVVSWSLCQASSFVTALADLHHGSFDWSSHQRSILAKILAKLRVTQALVETIAKF